MHSIWLAYEMCREVCSIGKRTTRGIVTQPSSLTPRCSEKMMSGMFVHRADFINAHKSSPIVKIPAMDRSGWTNPGTCD